MTRTITTAAELDALPAGSVVLDRWGCARQKGRDSLWHAVQHHMRTTAARGPVLVLHDPSAPAPAPSVVPEAAVALRDVIDEALADALGDTFSPSVMDDLARRVHARVTAALPLLTAAPSVTRDEVSDVLVMTRLSDYAGADMAVIDQTADALLARFNITPKEDR